MKIKHEWIFDLPWHIVDIRDWFYMVNHGALHPVYFLHVRVLGLRSLWKIQVDDTSNPVFDTGIPDRWL